MSPNKKLVLRKRENKGPPLQLERSLGSNESYLSNVTFTESTAKLFQDPGTNQFFKFSACGTFVELNVKNQKCLPCPFYKPHKISISDYLHHLSRGLDLYLGHYDNLLVFEDFNCQTSVRYLDDFCKLYNLSDMVKKTCFKNPNNPS